ncbi:uncharacterized protein isoform X6 [Leptinotarsa decemlineata]|uniref:uncharacterized protein isoform X6 n=1 Tax=Leptinotarsa decemlineata TaxID=7539 RepID=UPI003D307386
MIQNQPQVERPGSPDMFEGDEVAMVQEVKASTSGGVQRPRSPVSFQEERVVNKAKRQPAAKVVGRPPTGILRDVPHRSH